MEFRAKAATFRTRRDSISLRHVWDIENAELSANGENILKRIESSGDPIRAVYHDVCWHGQALLEFQDLQLLPLPKSGPFPLNTSFLFCESLNVLRQVLLCGLNGQVHAALAALRSSLEAFVCHYWWRRRLLPSDDYEPFYDWLLGSEPLRNFARILTDTLNELERPPHVFVFDELKTIYSLLCSYAHKPLLDEAIIRVRGGNTPGSNDSETFYWLGILQKTQRCMVDVAVLSTPLALFPVDLYRKFGFKVPLGVFLDLYSGHAVEQALGHTAFAAYQKHFENLDPPSGYVAWYNGLPDLSDEELLATWDEEAPNDRPEYSAKDKIALRVCQMKAKMRAMLWSFSYYDIMNLPDESELKRKLEQMSSQTAKG
jgi:hypothetical protein